MTLRTFTRLVRIPNLPTALADVLAGYVVAAAGAAPAFPWLGAALPAWLTVVALLTAGCLLYCGGMADNDVQHAEKDRLLGKPRPIPQGDISRSAARLIALGLTDTGVVLAVTVAVSVSMSLIATPAVFIVCFSLIYNRLARGRVRDGRYTPPSRAANVSGAVLLAACRVLNVCQGALLGAATALAAADVAVTPHALLTAMAAPAVAIMLATIGVYFLLVIGASLLEDFGGGARGLKVLRWLLLIPLCAGPAYLMATRIGDDGDARALLTTALPAGILLVALNGVLQYRLRRAIADPRPPVIGQVVRWGIIGECWLLAAFVALSGEQNLGPALIVASLFFVCMGLGRFGAST